MNTRHATHSSHRRLAGRFSALLGSVLLAACGGGFSLGIGYVYDDDDYYDVYAPSVSLAVAQTSVVAGQPVDMVAAAADENGIESVTFFRLDGDFAVLLGTDGVEPFEWQTLAPTDGRTRLLLFARATDRAGNRADSAVVQVFITP